MGEGSVPASEMTRERIAKRLAEKVEDASAVFAKKMTTYLEYGVTASALRDSFTANQRVQMLSKEGIQGHFRLFNRIISAGLDSMDPSPIPDHTTSNNRSSDETPEGTAGLFVEQGDESLTWIQRIRNRLYIKALATLDEMGQDAHVASSYRDAQDLVS